MDLNLGGSKKKEDHVKKKKYSIITLDLYKPTKKLYPEFDYERICKQYLNEADSSGEDERFHDRESEEIWKRLEQKYGGKKDKRGRKIRFGCADDYMDKTLGYDLTDPFIDDTEAYDEHVPSALDTVRGGFYVNKGKLEFKSKYAEDDSDSDVEETVVKKKTAEKRRRISSDEEADDSKRPCTPQPTKPAVDSNSSMDSDSTLVPTPLRLSSTGAAPTAKPSDIPRNRVITQQIIKKRRLLGQPPTVKVSQSPTMKAALGVKKKLKPQAKKVAAAMTTDDLAGFLKDMAGGEVEPVEGMDAVMKEVAEEKVEEVSKNATSTSPEHDTDIEKPVIPPSEKEPPPETASISSLALPSNTAPVPKRSPGRPPGSTSQPKPMPVMSDKLRAMIDTYKQKTKEFGAPNKKIRLPPSLVDLCIRIEEQCTLEGFNHQQKTRVFDLLANWVCLQRNSLYIRMKAHRDRHEPNVISDSDVNTDEPPSGGTKETPRTANDEILHDTNHSSSSVLTSISPSAISDATIKSPLEDITLSQEKKEALVSVKRTGSIDVAKTSSTTQRPAATKEVITKIGTVPTTAATANTDVSPSAKTASNPATAASSSKTPVTTANVVNALKNTQLLSVFATMMQQARVGDAVQQQQRIVDSLTAQMSAAFLTAKQQPELLAQYQLALSNLAKMATTTSATSIKSASTSTIPPKPTTSKTDLQPQSTKTQPKSSRPLSAGGLTPTTSKGLKQPPDEKAARALKEINSALAYVVSEVEKAAALTENEFIKEKMRAEKEGKTVPAKRFIWTDSLRAALKKQVNLLFTRLEQHGDPAHVVNPTVAQYLYYTVRPIFKDLVKFRDLVLEILRLCPERRQLVLIPEMNAFIEMSDGSKPQSGASHAAMKARKSMKPEVPSYKIAQGKAGPSGAVPRPVVDVENSRPSVTQSRKENEFEKYRKGSTFKGERIEIVTEKSSAEKARPLSPKPNKSPESASHEVIVQKNASSSRSTVVFNPKLTPGQKAMLARENRERERLLAEKAAAEKARKEREETERKLQEQREREEAENRKRDEEAIRKWEQEEAERLEASRDEDEEDVAVVEPEHFAVRMKPDLNEVEEVELGADTEVDMNTEEDVNVDRKSGSQMSNSESEQTCSSTETEQLTMKKPASSSVMSEQSSPRAPPSTSSVQSTFSESPPVQRIVRPQSDQHTNVIRSTPPSSYKQSSALPQNPSQQHTDASTTVAAANIPLPSQASQRSNSSQPQLSPLEQAMREIISSPTAVPQVSNSPSSSSQPQQSWSTKQQSFTSAAAASAISNNRQVPTSHSTQSYSVASAFAAGTGATSQMAQQQQPAAFSSFPVQQQQQIHYKNPQAQYAPTIRHASQVIAQQPIQDHSSTQRQRPMQNPYGYPISTYGATIQKSTLPTCSVPQNASQAYGHVPSSQHVMYQQRSGINAAGCSSAFSPLPPSPSRQQQMSQQLAYNQQQQQQQQFMLQQQQQRQQRLFAEQQQQQQQMNASQHHQMYGNWR